MLEAYGPQETVLICAGLIANSFSLKASGSGAERRSWCANHSGSAALSNLLHNWSLASHTALSTGSTSPGS